MEKLIPEWLVISAVLCVICLFALIRIDMALSWAKYGQYRWKYVRIFGYLLLGHIVFALLHLGSVYWISYLLRLKGYEICEIG